MKLRYFLRGLGAGIIFTVLVLSLSGSNTEKEALTDNEIMARARKLGMVTKDEKLDESLSQMKEEQQTQKEEEKADTEAEKEEADTAGNDAESAETAAQDMEKPEAEEEKAEDLESAESEQASQEDTPESVVPEPLEEEEAQVIAKLTISRGMGSKQVAAALKQLGVIENAEAFDSYLCNNGYSSKICTGTFTIEGTPEYSELARIITTKRW